MTICDCKYDVIARRYAEALFQSAKDIDCVDKIYEELKFASETVQDSDELKDFLLNKIVSNADKKDVLEKLFKIHISDITFNFLCLLVDNSRFDALHCVVKEYKKDLNDINNVLIAEIISAVKIPEELKNRLIQKLEEKTSKKIEADYKIDRDIIAGLVINVKEKTIDSSLKSKINNMKKQLI